MFPENYNQYSGIEFCLRCGYSFQEFLKSGKIGCGNCFISFQDAILPYKKIEKKFQHKKWEEFLSDKKKFFLNIQKKIPESEIENFHLALKKFTSQKFTKLIDLESQIFQNFPNSKVSFRYRIARNLKEFVYPVSKFGKETSIKTKIKTKVLKLFQSSASDKNKEDFVRFESNLNCIFFDEDHFRLEFFSLNGKFFKFFKEYEIFFRLLNSKNLFDYFLGIGYITSCPTNIGLANKLSVYIDLPSFHEKENWILESMVGDSFDFVLENVKIAKEEYPKTRLYIYKKNISKRQIFSFYEFVYFLLEFDKTRKISK
ncbi:MAG: hypothetical protein L6Q54_13240 [Leptospiraceae bacterium]|nr:hypothetical protein [Leptospiraceae bacterium]MCK6382199.1 hypothetical protein [Leptospiraceae bacterium]NUM42664.1 hypothetical protein [Leptospiraceae bacterium]